MVQNQGTEFLMKKKKCINKLQMTEHLKLQKSWFAAEKIFVLNSSKFSYGGVSKSFNPKGLFTQI